jgi:hypothetical protein
LHAPEQRHVINLDPMLRQQILNVVMRQAEAIAHSAPW